MSSLEINLTTQQHDFLNLNSKFGLFRAGIGTGKTFVGSWWAYQKLCSDPLSKGFIGANTYNQLRNATLSRFFETLDSVGVPYSYNQQRNIIDVAGRKIYAYSLDNYEHIRGIEIGWGWIDEAAFAKEAAFRVLIGRLRDSKAKRLELRLTTSAFGFNWLYDYFEGERKTPEFKTVVATTFDNPYLPEGYAESLRDVYDEKVYQQEVLGEYVSIGTGSVYYVFNRSKHLFDLSVPQNARIFAGIDFNVVPMSAAIGFLDGETLNIIDEIVIHNSNTDEMAKEILKRYGKISVIPDSTGKRIVTSARGYSDHEILRQYGLNVQYNKNPARMDRYNVVNNLLEKGRLKINKKCTRLIKDLEKLRFKEGSSQLDLGEDKLLSHISDALGYLAWFHFPIVRPSGGVYQLDT
jgi:PBSX family phage terminase large subunit